MASGLLRSTSCRSRRLFTCSNRLCVLDGDSDAIPAQVKARSRILYSATLAYESTHYSPKIKNLDLNYDINHGLTTVPAWSYELHTRLELSIKALAYPFNSCGVKRVSSAGRARHSDRKIDIENIKTLMFSDEKDCCRWVVTRNSG